ncbi:MAG: MipA/OmpV family protein [Pseudomonadota bacterium]
MKPILAMCAMLAIYTPALAESTRMLMPEGSKDVQLSLLGYFGPAAEGSSSKRLRILPMISAQWANGVFVRMNVIGMQLSDSGNMTYGVLLAPTMTYTSTRSRFTPEAGAYLSYHVAYGVELTSALMYGGSIDHRGLSLDLGVHLSMPVAEHHTMGLAAGAKLANRAALEANYGVTPDQASASMPVHAVDGGLRDTAFSANWRWEISTRYSLATTLAAHRLHGSAASSPRMEQPGGIGLATILTYHY